MIIFSLGQFGWSLLGGIISAWLVAYFLPIKEDVVDNGAIQYIVPGLVIGGHEVYGGISGREMGDATKECPDKKSMNTMLDYLVSDREIIPHMCDRIDELKKAGFYDGAYECVKLAVKGHE